MQKIIYRAKGNALIGLLFLSVMLAVIGGWIANIIKLIGMDGGFTAMFIARIVGIFVPPFGVIVGYL